MWKVAWHHIDGARELGKTEYGQAAWNIGIGIREKSEQSQPRQRTTHAKALTNIWRS